MPWLSLLAYFFGGVFLGNAIPHVVSGMMGRPFQSPFAKPPGEGFPRRPSKCFGAFSTSSRA
jgi:hypothetical protein